MNSDNYNVLDITMPTYLQDIFRSTEFINLICVKVHASSVSSTADVVAPTINTSANSNDLNLTGNPLEVDLGEEVNFDVLQHERRPNNWTKAEATYGAVKLTIARKFLNATKSKNFQVCLCDGKDARKTLAIFRNFPQFIRGMVMFYGCYTLKQEEVSFERMLQYHKKFCASDAKVNLEVNTLYPIIGFNKRLAEEVPAGVGNSAFIEVLCQEATSTSINDEYKLFLQVNVSNSDSKFHPLWHQLDKIYNFITQLQDDDELESIVISEDPKAFHEVADDITTLLRSYGTKQYLQKNEINWKDLDVMNVRDEDFLDNLWQCLIKMENLEAVRNGFDSLFADLVEAPPSYTIPITSQSTLGVILNSLIEGNTVVPTLTLPSCLKFMIELGLNKLHNDYSYLVQNLDSKGDAHFKERWEKSTQVNNQVSKAALRKSRMTIPKGNENIGELITHLNHLTNMHLTIEFMHLAKSCTFSETGTLPQIYDQIYKSKSLNKTFKSLKYAGIVDFQCDLFSNQFHLIQDLPAVAVNIKHFSQGRGKSSVTTIFHLSEKPIFPEVVFQDYEIDASQIDGKQYYVHVANIFVD